MSKHLSRKERWTERDEEFVCSDGVVCKEDSGWSAWFREGANLKIIGKGFKRARNAMICIEEAAKQRIIDFEPLPPIHFKAHIFC